MRVVWVIPVIALLGGCFSYGRTDPPYPRPQASPRATSDDSRVERWTREQRDCEVGNRKKQRKCVMGYPEE